MERPAAKLLMDCQVGQQELSPGDVGVEASRRIKFADDARCRREKVRILLHEGGPVRGRVSADSFGNDDHEKPGNGLMIFAGYAELAGQSFESRPVSHDAGYQTVGSNVGPGHEYMVFVVKAFRVDRSLFKILEGRARRGRSLS